MKCSLLFTGAIVFLIVGYLNLKCAGRYPEGLVCLAGGIVLAGFAQSVWISTQIGGQSQKNAAPNDDASSARSEDNDD